MSLLPEDFPSRLDWALEVMGYEGVRDGQQPIIESVASGANTIGVMPTGSGKSATFILPCLGMRWRALVVSPLIALQADQVRSLKALGLTAEAINSNMAPSYVTEIKQQWKAGQIQFLYLSPEQFTNERVLQDLCQVCPPNLVVVDEVHTGAEWKSFRPSYLKITEAHKSIGSPPMLCLTATLTPKTEEYLRGLLGLEEAAKFVFYQERKNLVFHSFKNLGTGQFVKEMRKYVTGPTIVYCPTVREIEGATARWGKSQPGIFELLNDYYSSDGGVVKYHGKLDAAERTIAQQLFTQGRAKVVVATNAFGMGVDIPNIRVVAHTGIPSTVEGYIQEVGRAGRDGEESHCLVNFTQESYETRRWMIENKFPSKRLVQNVLAVFNADPEGLVISLEELTNEAKWQSTHQVSAAVSLLTAAGLIERTNSRYAHTVSRGERWGQNMALPQLSPRQTALKEAVIDKVSESAVAKWSEVPQETSRGFKLKGGEINDVLGRMSATGVVKWVKASRSKKTSVVDTDIEKIDWEAQELGLQEELHGLHQLRTFIMVPDDRKHEAARIYFETGELPALDNQESQV